MSQLDFFAGGATPPVPKPAPTVAKLDLQTLESWLWDSANILRGSIDSSDFKNYIFGLLFLKRANDVFEEEVAGIVARGAGAAGPAGRPAAQCPGQAAV